jgi:tetratricopeptide (TPR) repeat protein
MMPLPAAPSPLLTPFEQALKSQEAGQLENAELFCRQAIAEQPQYFPSRHLLGLICAHRGNHEDALIAFNIALNIDPKRLSPTTIEASSFRRSGGSPTRWQATIRPSRSSRTTPRPSAIAATRLPSSSALTRRLQASIGRSRSNLTMGKRLPIEGPRFIDLADWRSSSRTLLKPITIWPTFCASEGTANALWHTMSALWPSYRTLRKPITILAWSSATQASSKKRGHDTSAPSPSSRI